MATMAAMAAMSAIQLLFERRMLSTGACLFEPYDSEMYELLGERFEICAVQFPLDKFPRRPFSVMVPIILLIAKEKW